MTIYEATEPKPPCGAGFRAVILPNSRNRCGYRRMRAKPIVSVVTADGERLAVSEARHPSRSYARMFRTTFIETDAQLARIVSNGATFKVLLILPKHLSYTVFKRLDQRKLGVEIDLTDSAVSRALSHLHELGVVERRGRGPVTEWKLSPDFGWRGDVDSYHAEQRKRGSPSPGKPGARGLPAVAECILWKEIYPIHSWNTDLPRRFDGNVKRPQVARGLPGAAGQSQQRHRRQARLPHVTYLGFPFRIDPKMAASG